MRTLDTNQNHVAARGVGDVVQIVVGSVNALRFVRLCTPQASEAVGARGDLCGARRG